MMKLTDRPVARTLAVCFLFVLAGCEKKTERALAKATPAPAHPGQIEVCRLITNDEITAVQGVPVKESKSSALTQGQFVVTQCVYETSDFSKSVNLALVSKDSAGGADPAAYWRKQFSPAGEDKSIAAATTAPAGADREPGEAEEDGTNFRSDVTFDGSLNSADIGLVKSKSGTALSGPTPNRRR